MANKLTDWLEKGHKYIIELDVTENNEETASQVLESVLKGTELMPGIVVNKLYRQNFNIEDYQKEMIDTMVEKLKDKMSSPNFLELLHEKK